MTTGLANSVLDNGLNYLKANANAAHLVNITPSSTYDPAVHTRAWVLANTLGNIALSGANFAGPQNGPASGRELVLQAATGAFTQNLPQAAGNLWLAIISVTEVLAWANEVSERQIISGQPMTVPSIPFRIKE